MTDTHTHMRRRHCRKDIELENEAMALIERTIQSTISIIPMPYLSAITISLVSECAFFTLASNWNYNGFETHCSQDKTNYLTPLGQMCVIRRFIIIYTVFSSSSSSASIVRVFMVRPRMNFINICTFEDLPYSGISRACA